MLIQFISIAVAFSLIGVWFSLVRHGSIREKYAVQWIVLGCISVILAVFPALLNTFAKALGIADPPNLLAFLGIWFLIGVVAHLTLEVNKLEDRVRILAEELALLKTGHPNMPARPAADQPSDGQPPTNDPLSPPPSSQGGPPTVPSQDEGCTGRAEDDQ